MASVRPRTDGDFQINNQAGELNKLPSVWDVVQDSA